MTLDCLNPKSRVWSILKNSKYQRRLSRPAYRKPAPSCAPGSHLGDLHQREILPMSTLALGILPPPFLEGVNLGAARLFDDFGGDAHPFYEGRADLRSSLVHEHEDFVEQNRVARHARHGHDRYDIFSGDAILLAARLNHREHLFLVF